MKIKIVVIDLEIPPRVKKWGLRIGIPLGVLFGGGAVAWAAGLHTWNDGDTLTSADLNSNFAYLQTEITTLQSQVHPASAFRAEVTGSAPNIPNAISIPFTTVTFNNVLFDLSSEYNATTGKFTAKNAGTYLVTCAVYYGPTITGAQYSAIAMKNNTGVIDGTDLEANGGLSLRPEATSTINLAAGDTVACTTYQNSGASQALEVVTSIASYNSFSVTRLY